MKLIFTCLLLSLGLSAQTWLQIADLPADGRDDAAAVQVNGKLFFGTGLTSGWAYGKDFYVLDPVNNNWSSIPSMPEGAQRQYACAFAGQNAFYIFAGDGIGGPLNNLYKYDISQSSWTLKTARPGNGIFGSSCLAFGDKIIIVGGKFQGNGMATAEVWEYTISTDSWLRKNDFPYGGRFRASADVLNNIGYLMFGIDENSIFRKEMYSYNQAADSWTKILDFPQTNGRSYASMKSVDDKLILFGGYDQQNFFYKDLWFFKPVSNTWIQDQDIPSFGRRGGMGVVVGNKFYYSCGIDVANTRIKETWMLDVPVGLGENKKTDYFSIYPNPVKDILNIEDREDKYSEKAYSINDVYGREIIKTTSLGVDINLADLREGIYFLKITSNKDTEIKKLVKQ